MKTLVLKEDQALYDVVAQAPPDEPIIIEREGQPYKVLLPYEEYQAFRMWRARQRLVLPDNRFEQTPEEVVADIRRQGPGVPNVRRATASLAELLADSPHDPDFTLEKWEREWAAIEAEIEANDPQPGG